MADLRTTFADIANAIRAKGGTSDKIVPTDMATAITNLPSGGNEDTYTVEFEVAPAQTSVNNTIMLQKYITISPSEDIIGVFWSANGQTASYVPEYNKVDIVVSRPQMGNDFALVNHETNGWVITAKHTNSFQSNAMVFYKKPIPIKPPDPNPNPDPGIDNGAGWG